MEGPGGVGPGEGVVAQGVATGGVVHHPGPYLAASAPKAPQVD